MEETTSIAINYGPALAILGGSIAALLGGIGSVLGVRAVGIMGSGIVTKKPETFGKVLVLEALPGSQAIYGIIGAFLVLNFFDVQALDLNQGLSIMFACLPLGLTALFSGIFQGKVAAAGLNIIAKNPAGSGQAIILAAIVETFAIFGLLATFLLLNNIKAGI
jgi:V/A-type H+-transporting ATPase subunit K